MSYFSIIFCWNNDTEFEIYDLFVSIRIVQVIFTFIWVSKVHNKRRNFSKILQQKQFVQNLVKLYPLFFLLYFQTKKVWYQEICSRSILTFELKFWRNAAEATINPCNKKWRSLTATVATALSAVVDFVRWRSSEEIFAWIIGPTLLLRQSIGLQQD